MVQVDANSGETLSGVETTPVNAEHVVVAVPKVSLPENFTAPIAEPVAIGIPQASQDKPKTQDKPKKSRRDRGRLPEKKVHFEEGSTTTTEPVSVGVPGVSLPEDTAVPNAEPVAVEFNKVFQDKVKKSHK